jgi:uncharacterized membrane protein
MSIALALHLLGVIIWVGGMFFAHVILRVVLNQMLEPHERLPLLLKVFDKFFSWVWVAVIVILASGYWMLFSLYSEESAFWLSFMSGGGTLMAAIFIFIYALPYHQLGTAINCHDMPKAVASLALTRKLILTNLILGILITVITAAGKYGLF